MSDEDVLPELKILAQEIGDDRDALQEKKSCELLLATLNRLVDSVNQNGRGLLSRALRFSY